MEKPIKENDFIEEGLDLITFNGRLPSIEELRRLLMVAAMKQPSGNPSIFTEMADISR